MTKEFDYAALAIYETSPVIGRFFEGVEEYSKDSMDDTKSSRYIHTLTLARFIFTHETYKYSCVPGKMTTEYFGETKDHNNEDCYYSKEYSVTLIDEEKYNELRSRKEIQNNTESELRTFHNCFYLSEEILEDDFLITKAYYSDLTIVSRVKGMNGYFLFEFKE